MVVSCEHVWQEISNYLEGEISQELREAMEAHFKECKHCTAVLDGTRNVIQLYGDDRVFELPAGFDQRLRLRLAQEARSSRPRSGMVWALAVAASALLAGSYALAKATTSGPVAVLSEQAQPAIGIPPGLLVNVAEDGKLFHVPGCKFLHEKPNGQPKSMQASEAIGQGYAPCIRCLRRYLLERSAETKKWGGDRLEVEEWSAGQRPRPQYTARK